VAVRVWSATKARRGPVNLKASERHFPGFYIRVVYCGLNNGK